MSARIRNGLRTAAKDRLDRQVQEGRQLLQDLELIDREDAFGGASREHIILEKRRAHRTAMENWKRATEVLLRKYFDSSEFAVEFLNETQEGSSYGDPLYNPTAEALQRGINVIASVLHVIDDLDEEPAEMAVVPASGLATEKNTPREASDILKVLNLVERKLRTVVREVPQREQQVQDAMENLLLGADIDYSRETDSIEYSSKTYTPDFSLPRIDLTLEMKLSNRAEREKEIIAEVNDDILAYKTKYGNILFVVYDVGFIRDIERFARQFEQHEGVLVRVIKH